MIGADVIFAIAAKLDPGSPSAVNRFYFDHNATTPVSPEALDALVRTSRDVFGNASSIHHAGQDARRELECARKKVASLLAVDAREIVFCSGGTEANNTALFGVARKHAPCHIVTTAIEHPAVLQTAAQLEREGCTVTCVKTGNGGFVDPQDVAEAIKPSTALISVMHVNNEIGTVQPIGEIARIARARGIAMHSDGVQAAGRIAVDLRDLDVDLYSVSGHKMYAPKGVGVLYIRKNFSFDPLLYGGRHEGDRRAGTENVPGAAAMGVAAEAADFRLASEGERLGGLRDRFEDGLRARVPQMRINGLASPRAPNTSSICIDGIEGEAVVIALDLKGFSISSGAACSSGSVEPSHVLTAIGLSRRDAKSSIRVSLGSSNDKEQVDALIKAVADVAERLRKLSHDYAAHV